MGKAVPRNIKMRAETLLQSFPERFGSGFDENKRVIDMLELPLSKFDRNMIAGFITRKINEKNKAN
ncbi:MAG: 30S ribosomal protein S17e [Candidatus Diapherotrites archaeon]|uniref:30S ribosomal protein S17e n=1 Tax=Candidatus Iainarchaeum sp. TaxID=3101447 RepID=A0A938YWU0_9ARCH|nr:30S ribosomal protein S17e [Candidatus Diapherotrites archaeon]